MSWVNGIVFVSYNEARQTWVHIGGMKMSIVNQLMPLVLEYNKMALANNIEYAQHLTIKIDEILKNADIDSQNDEDF